MWLLISALLLGVALGRWLKPGPEVRRVVGWISLASLCVLLAALGASLGVSDKLIRGLRTMGCQALALALGAVVGSVALVWALQTTALRGLTDKGADDS